MARLITAVAVIIMTATACNPDDPPASPRLDASPTAGLLRSGIDGVAGFAGLYAPEGNEAWAGTFSSDILGTIDGTPITLDSVEYDFGVEPLSVEALLRRVPPAFERRGGGDWSPQIKRVGRPPQLATKPRLLRGEFHTIDGQQVTQRCARPRVLQKAAYVELLIVVTGKRHGASIEGFTIHYTADGESYELPIEWTFALCGPRLDETDCGPAS